MTKLDKAMAALEAAQERQALELDALPDSLTLACGVRMYRATVPHAWVIARISQMGRSLFSGYDIQLCCAYVLAHSSRDVQNRLAHEARTKLADLPAAAEKYFIEQGADVIEVLESTSTLLQEIKPKTAMGSRAAGSSRDGGAASSTASPPTTTGPSQ